MLRQLRDIPLRGVAKINSEKDECPHGHRYTFENTYHDTFGRRRCRRCLSAYRVSYNQRVRTRGWMADLETD